MSSKEMIAMLTEAANRNSLLQAGVRNLREFGYSNASTENILKVNAYKAFFKRMLEDEGNENIPGAKELLAEINRDRK